MQVCSSARRRCAWIVLIPIVGLLLFLRTAFGSDPQQQAMKNKLEGRQNIVVTIVYDNNPLDQRLTTAWGFACIIEGLSETILFDSGGKGGVLLSNMAKAGFKLEQIDGVVLSHFHGDHTGGLNAFLQVNSGVRVFLPKAFPPRFKQQVSRSGAEVVETEGPRQVSRCAWTTGVLRQGIEEQGLYLETTNGLVVITGCAHPGIVPLAGAARSHAKMPVYAVVGGLHMTGTPGDKIDAVIRDLKEMGVQQVAPCHCSGDNTRRLMRRAFGEGYLPSGVGARLVFPARQQKTTQ